MLEKKELKVLEVLFLSWGDFSKEGSMGRGEFVSSRLVSSRLKNVTSTYAIVWFRLGESKDELGNRTFCCSENNSFEISSCLFFSFGLSKEKKRKSSRR